MHEVSCGTVELADAAKVNKETISLWRGGQQKSYRYEKVARVAARLGTTAEDLLDLPVLEKPAQRPAAPRKATASPRQQKLVRRIAALGPVIEGLSELEEVVAEARKLSQD